MINDIIKILSEWDPIGVGYPLSLSEYSHYAPKLSRLITDEEGLRKCIYRIVDELGLSGELLDAKIVDRLISYISSLAKS